MWFEVTSSPMAKRVCRTSHGNSWAQMSLVRSVFLMRIRLSRSAMSAPSARALLTEIPKETDIEEATP